MLYVQVFIALSAGLAQTSKCVCLVLLHAFASGSSPVGKLPSESDASHVCLGLVFVLKCTVDLGCSARSLLPRCACTALMEIMVPLFTGKMYGSRSVIGR